MANNSRVSRSTSIEDLREKNVQIEAEVNKLTEDMREVIKKQAKSSKKLEESSKRQEESQRRLEESNRILEGKLGSLSQMLERAIRQFSGHAPVVNGAETSNAQANKAQAEGVSRNNMGVRIEERSIEDEGNMNQDLNSEELNWAENQVRNRDRGVRTDRRGVQMPKMEFPQFNGSDPKVCRAKCEHYFDIYEIPEVYKSRMALINFSEEVHEWYSCLVGGGPPLPWDLLVEQVLARYQDGFAKDPVDVFKRVHQIGRVDEYVRKFDKSRVRLLSEKPALDEAFFVSGFISGLKDEIKPMVEMFNPRTLISVYKYAAKAEATFEAQNKKPKEISKGYKTQRFPYSKPKAEFDKQPSKEGQQPKQGYSKLNNQAPNYEQRKELGLCHWCHEKYFPGHKCAGRVLRLEEGNSSGSDESEEERGDKEPDEEQIDEVEQATISMYASNDKNKVKSMKFEGHIGQTPILALLDSGSTHSFADPVLVKGLKIPTVQTSLMVVRVANGECMVTETFVKN